MWLVTLVCMILTGGGAAVGARASVLSPDPRVVPHTRNQLGSRVLVRMQDAGPVLMTMDALMSQPVTGGVFAGASGALVLALSYARGVEVSSRKEQGERLEKAMIQQGERLEKAMKEQGERLEKAMKEQDERQTKGTERLEKAMKEQGDRLEKVTTQLAVIGADLTLLKSVIKLNITQPATWT